MKTIKGNGRIRVLVLLVLSGLGDAPGLHREPDWVLQGCDDHAIVESLDGEWLYDCDTETWSNLENEEEN